MSELAARRTAKEDVNTVESEDVPQSPVPEAAIKEYEDVNAFLLLKESLGNPHSSTTTKMD